MKRTFTCKYTILEIFCDCEPPSKYYMPKLLTLDKEDNVMIYVCSYSHRSYIVIDPSTCGSCPLSLLAKIPHQVEILLVHPKTLKPKSYFQDSTIPTYGLSKILQVSFHRCNKAIKIASKSVRSFSVRENRALYELG